MYTTSGPLDKEWVRSEGEEYNMIKPPSHFTSLRPNSVRASYFPFPRLLQSRLLALTTQTEPAQPHCRFRLELFTPECLIPPSSVRHQLSDSDYSRAGATCRIHLEKRDQSFLYFILSGEARRLHLPNALIHDDSLYPGHDGFGPGSSVPNRFGSWRRRRGYGYGHGRKHGYERRPTATRRPISANLLQSP